MRYLKSFKKFINEGYNDSGNTAFGISSQAHGMNLSASFGYSDLSTVSGGAQPAYDAQLSFDEYDRHKNNYKDSLNRAVGISKNVFTQNIFNFGYELISDIQDLYIVRMYANNNGFLDIYIKFTLDEKIFYGKFEDFGGINEPIFTSKMLWMPQIMNHEDNKIRLIGLLKETLEKWFQPKEDEEYRTLKEIKVYDNVGKIFIIPQGGKILIEDVVIQDYKPLVFMKYGENVYTFSGIEYYFFNWWFKKEEKKEFYL